MRDRNEGWKEKKKIRKGERYNGWKKGEEWGWDRGR